MAPRLIICGLEHSGTTLVSELFRQVPGLDSGFECGVLLDATPSAFLENRVFAQQMLKGWGLTQPGLAAICAAPDFDGFYAALLSRASGLKPDTTHIFDKTPRYLWALDAVMARSDAPVIITHKDPRAMVASDFRRAGDVAFDAWYDSYLPRKHSYVSTCYAQFLRNKTDLRVCSIALEDTVFATRATLERMFAHVAMPFDLRYALFGQARFANVKARAPSADVAFQYLRELPAHALPLIARDFAEFDQWFYD